MRLEEKIYDFAYQNDYWDFMAYNEEKYGEDFDKELVIDEIRAILEQNPGYFAEYVEQWDTDEAVNLAQEIRARS